MWQKGRSGLRRIKIKFSYYLIKNFMKYKNKKLYIENLPIEKLAKKYGTPLYCYSLNKIKDNIANFKNNFKSINPTICFSVKSNSNIHLLKIIKKMGLGADVVSKGELLKVLKVGMEPKKIVFSGVGKNYDELNLAIKKKILLINVESESEIKQIEKIANKIKTKVNIGIRLNPDIDPLTNSKISTGRKEDKFGISKKQFVKIVKKINSSKNLNLQCLSVHIGSQITNYKPYSKMLNVIENLIKKTKHNFNYVDLGGGMGIKYEKNSKELNYQKYSSLIGSFLKKNKTKIIFEPGRSIIGDAGILISKIIYIKDAIKIKFVIMDAAMNDLIRPALYGAKHEIKAVKKNNIKINKLHEFVGPVCETSDKFSSLKKYQKLNENDLLAIYDVGAYGMALSSNYNLRAKPAEILVDRSKVKVITKRQLIKNLI